MAKTQNSTEVAATPTGAAPEIALRNRPVPDGNAGWADTVEGALTASLRVVRDVLPASRIPVYLAGSALLVTGLIDPPVALGAGLAYEALRRWEPRAAR
ncbi:hypothetical protein [Actinomycetospora sp. TBRC 11914]|uniref:hypothetical protein n=1 Tax=Actinomycetospora sp. TBRC 11914 TaxID=2729387 RepID=UPI00145F7BD1|nr:hypothetical protein [Actinomycetospora sp. TBRC 11914]NMO94043.1 hypothetical protein [Actinomycetospora sp. TBRC 11914]